MQSVADLSGKPRGHTRADFFGVRWRCDDGDGGGCSSVGGGRWIRGEVGAERRQLIAGAYRTPAEVKIKRHEARPFGGTVVESLSSSWG